MDKPHKATRQTWQDMKQRCYNPKAQQFKNYGARGIKVCDRWRDSFDNFFADMGDKPPGMSLDRINNAGNYEPGNCRWASKKQQNNNRRGNVIISFNGESLTMTQWAERLGMCRDALRYRLYTARWPLDKALSLKPIAGFPLAARGSEHG